MYIKGSLQKGELSLRWDVNKYSHTNKNAAEKAAVTNRLFIRKEGYRMKKYTTVIKDEAILEREMKPEQYDKFCRMKKLVSPLLSVPNISIIEVPTGDTLKSGTRLAIRISIGTSFTRKNKELLSALTLLADAVSVGCGVDGPYCTMSFSLLKIWKDFYHLCPDHDAAGDYEGTEPGYWDEFMGN